MKKRILYFALCISIIGIVNDQLVLELSEGGKVKKRYIRGNDRG